MIRDRCPPEGEICSGRCLYICSFQYRHVFFYGKDYEMKTLRLIAAFAMLALFSPVVNAQTISGHVFVDSNANGVFDSGEHTVGGVAITDGVQFVVTDSDGSYKIETERDILLSNGGTPIISMSTPSGYKPATAWFKRTTEIDDVQNVNFALAVEQQSLPFVFIHASDLHVPRFSRDFFINFKKDVQELADRVKFCVITGDLVDMADKHTFSQSKNEYDFFAEQTADFGVPLYCTPGNHDLAGVLTKKRGWKKNDPLFGYGFYTQYIGPLRWSFNYADIHFVGVDYMTLSNGKWSQGVPEAAVKWLEADLELAGEGRRIFLFVHNARNQKQLIDVAVRYNVEQIFSGHFHCDRVVTDGPVPAVVSGSISHILVDKDTPVGYRVVTVSDEGLDMPYHATGDPHGANAKALSPVAAETAPTKSSPAYPRLLEAFHKALDDSVEGPLPATLESFLAAVGQADTLDIAGLDIFARDHENRLNGQYPTMTGESQFAALRRKKAIAESRSEMFKIMNQRASNTRKRPARDGGAWNPFHGRFSLSPYQSDWREGPYTASLHLDTFGDLEGDDPAGPIAAVVTPQFDGSRSYYLPAISATCKVLADEPSWWDNYPNVFLHVQAFAYSFGGFELSPGICTGVNNAVLNPFGSPPWGQYNIDTKQFEIRLEGMFINDLYNVSTPMLFFADISGAVGDDYSSGTTTAGEGSEVIAGTDNAMIVPLIGEHAKMDLPKLMGAHILSYHTRGGGTLRFRENTTLQANADISMVRYNDGSYAIDPAADNAIGARVVISPLTLASRGSDGEYEFAPGTITIEKNGKMLMRGNLVDCVLDVARGGFFAELQIVVTSDTSPVVREISLSEGTKMVQIASGPAAYDLIALTDGLTDPGDLPYPEIFHIGVVGEGLTPCVLRGDLNNDGTVNAEDLAIMGRYWLRSCCNNID